MKKKTVHESHYEDLQRVRTHAAITYYAQSRSTYSKPDRNVLDCKKAYCVSLLEKGADGYDLSKACDDLFEYITFALKRASHSKEKENVTRKDKQ